MTYPPILLHIFCDTCLSEKYYEIDEELRRNEPAICPKCTEKQFLSTQLVLNALDRKITALREKLKQKLQGIDWDRIIVAAARAREKEESRVPWAIATDPVKFSSLYRPTRRTGGEIWPRSLDLTGSDEQAEGRSR
jgi:hypothetical protein